MKENVAVGGPLARAATNVRPSSAAPLLDDVAHLRQELAQQVILRKQAELQAVQARTRREADARALSQQLREARQRADELQAQRDAEASALPRALQMLRGARSALGATRGEVQGALSEMQKEHAGCVLAVQQAIEQLANRERRDGACLTRLAATARIALEVR